MKGLLIKVFALVWIATGVAAASPKMVIEKVRSSPYFPLTSGMVNQSRAELKLAIQVLEKLLSHQSNEISVSWKEYLALGLVSKYANGEAIPEENLDRVIWKYSRNLPGLEYDEIVALRAALIKYRDISRIAILSEDEKRNQFEKKRQRLVENLEVALVSPEKVDTFEMGRLIQWMKSAGQLDSSLDDIKANFEKPNFHIKISSKILMSTLNTEETVDRTEPYRIILKALN